MNCFLTNLRPSLSEYRTLADTYPVVPVAAEISCDTETPVSAFYKLGFHQAPHSFLLESVAGGEQVSRYSFLGGDPFLTVYSHRKRVSIVDHHYEEVQTTTAEDPLHILERLLSDLSFPPLAGLPRFCGGAVGCISYDYARLLEPVVEVSAKDSGLPDIAFMFPRVVVAFDHAFRSLHLIVNTRPQSDADVTYQQALALLNDMAGKLQGKAQIAILPAMSRVRDLACLPPSSLPRERFVDAVNRIKQHIAAGDIFQAVLSQQFRTPADFDPMALYRVLRTTNPSPYTFYLQFPQLRLVGASPEVMVRVRDGEALVRPIAGTRPRAEDPDVDRKLAVELLSDEKELAEHMMLVDLGRNDLGRVCEYGSVQVRELKVIERYSHVMHIVSHVVGRLRTGVSGCDAIRATFPAGTVSGAPKIRAMQIIDSLEPVARGPYAGLVGYLSFTGDVDTCITIRTVAIADGEARIQAGAGIVADSEPEREYQETLSKAAAMLSAIEQVRSLGRVCPLFSAVGDMR